MYVKKYNYEKELNEAFKEINLSWIKRMFWVEDEDIAMLNNIDKLVDDGAEIYFTMSDNDEPLSCAMIMPFLDDAYEFAKFGTKEGLESKGAGRLCMEAALDRCKELTNRIIIISNTKCEAGIHMYKKYGFKEIVPDFDCVFDRCNIVLEYIVNK